MEVPPQKMVDTFMHKAGIATANFKIVKCTLIPQGIARASIRATKFVNCDLS